MMKYLGIFPYLIIKRVCHVYSSDSPFHRDDSSEYIQLTNIL